MKHTAEGLAAYAELCLGKKTKYMFGALMEPITEELIDRVTSRYPSHYPPERVEELRACIGTECYGTDCSGLIKSYYWGGIGSEEYDEGTDWNSGKLLYCSAKIGGMKTLPELPGVCLYMPGHVGIYMGGGKVIQSTHSDKYGDGVVCANLEDQAWTRWFLCPLIEYPELPKPAENGTGAVKKVQGKKQKKITEAWEKVRKAGKTTRRMFCCARTLKPYTKRSVFFECSNLIRKVYGEKIQLEEEMTRRILEARGEGAEVLGEKEYYEYGGRINKERYMRVVTDKVCLLARVSNLLKREYMDFKEATDEQAVAFCEKHKAVIVKDCWRSGGVGVHVYSELPEGEELKKLIQQWRETKRLYVIEELLTPHPELAKVFPDSLCTVRIHTLNCGGEVKIVLNSSIRFGRKGSLIDLCENSYTLYLDGEGNVLSGGAMNKYSMRLEQKHKDTGAEFSAVTIPYWNECCKLVKEAAKRVPEVPFVAWDVAITEKGVDLIEGNFLSGNVLPQQLYLSMTGRSEGLRPAIDAIWEEVSERCEEI